MAESVHGLPDPINLSEPFWLRLQAVTEQLAAADHQEQVVHIILDPARSALGAVASVLMLVEDDHLNVVACHGHDAVVQLIWANSSLDTHTPATDVLRTLHPLFYEHSGALRAAYTQLEAQTGGTAAVASAIIPLLLDGQAVGVLVLDFKEPHRFTEGEIHFLQTLANQCAVALDRARLIREQAETLRHAQASETRFRRLVQVSPVPIAVGAPDGSLVQVNDAYLALLGYTRAEFEAGRIDWLALTPPEDQPQDAAMFTQAFDEGESPPYFKTMLTKQGGRRRLRVQLLRYQDDERLLVIGYLEDVTEQQRLETANANLQGQVNEGAQDLTVKTRALDAFVSFTEVVGADTDDLSLARQAVTVLRTNLPDASVVVYRREEHVWRAQAWSEDVAGDLLAHLQAGLPLDIPVFAEVQASRTVHFVDGWDAAANGVNEAQSYGAVAIYPYLQEGKVFRLLTVGTQHQAAWPAWEQAIVRGVGRAWVLALDRTEQADRLVLRNAELYASTQALEGFAALTRDLAADTDRSALIRRAQELAQSLLPHGFAVYYEPEGGLWRLKSQVGDLGNPELQAVLDAGISFEGTPNLLIPWRTREPYYQDQYNHAADLLPEVTAQLQSTATLPVLIDGAPTGVFAFGLNVAQPWSRADKAALESIVRSLGLAIARAEHAQRLDEERAALDAFVAFTETVGRESNELELVQRAIEVLHATLAHISVTYYLLEEGLWKATVWSDNVPALVVAQLRRGIAQDAPHLAEAIKTCAPVFVDGWNAAAEHMDQASMYGAAAFVPLCLADEMPRLLAVGTQEARVWTARQQAVVRAVGRSLNLALERSDTTRQLHQQNAELEARSRALQGFAELSRDLAAETSRYALVRRAQEIMLSLLTPGYALYWEQAEDHWQLKSQVGDIGNPELQRLVDEQGLPLDAPALHSTWLTGVPNYQDNYAQGADTPAEMIRHVKAATAFQVRLFGRPVGMLAIGLFDQRTWTDIDKAVLETALYNLELALERAQSLEALEQSNAALQVSNEELEAFNYSVSHDLMTPVRHVAGFAELAGRHLNDPEKARQYLGIVDQGAKRMETLINAMLTLSRTGRQELKVDVVDLRMLVEQAQLDVLSQTANRQVEWRVGPLPLIRGDRLTLQQVMTNLIANAVKYSAGRDPATVEVWAEEDARQWTVFVRDNGAGFDSRYTDKLFGIFQRLHRQEEFEGTGVGLSLVRRIIARHGGTVSAMGAVGQGATFSFTLPKPLA